MQNSFRLLADPSSPTAVSAGSGITSLPFQAQTWGFSRRNTANLSRPLTDFPLGPGTGGKTFAAFKALPIDPARIRRGSSTSSGPYSETSEEVAGASSCREVVDRVVESIHRACEDIGGGQDGFVTDEDVVR